MTSILTTTVDSPVGPLTLTAADGFLTGVHMHEQRHARTAQGPASAGPPGG